MELFKVLIVDDETHCAKLLSYLLKKYCPNLLVSGVATNVNEAEILLNEINPDIVFFDILMNNELIFKLIDSIETINFQIIFTTAFDQYALKSIKVNAVDYLLKPINIHDLKNSVNKAILNCQNKVNFNETALNELKNYVKLQVCKEQKFIAISSKTDAILIREDNIVYCKSQGIYTIFILRNGEEYVSSKNVGEYEKKLTSSMFFRIHHSYIINLNYLIKVKGFYCELIDGTTLPLAKRRSKGLREIIKF
ncbi:LytTR family DNA-binding domain-containing protein [Tenacibaculum sp. FZY0031]|uniref:LytR/AlgR family response regulator transcription factor n=1 Tax=Tenacibaculum sp. FZY0031 TaxID=3116648 RepID=UPI002EC5E38B|nr:LytTR family DNA-binding domain-containing protein [Tenacibaculum sp. FZY0031]